MGEVFAAAARFLRKSHEVASRKFSLAEEVFSILLESPGKLAATLAVPERF